jgi:asparagine synthase (glutamine-hydrolysing)
LSAFAVIYERSNTPAPIGVLERMMGRLSHRGPDGRRVISVGQAALGHWHFWTTPEEIDEEQPLELTGLPFMVVLDGRLDNRVDLIAQLGLLPRDGLSLSDAVLVLRSFDLWGEACFEHFIGSFAVVVYDVRNHTLYCARDPMGDRTLFFTLSLSRLMIASEPWAVAGGLDIPPALDETGASFYLALEASPEGHTLFQNVKELLPGRVLAVEGSSQRQRTFWQPDTDKRIRYRTDQEYAEHFRSLLEESVRCRMRSPRPVGIMMSGGLDSTSVTCLAAQMTLPQPLTTLSYVFDELPECDERKYINTMQEKWGLRSIHLPSDQLWPLKEVSGGHFNPNQPEFLLYRSIRVNLYSRANQEGLRVLLNGDFGDHLYSGENDWLADLIADRKLQEAKVNLSLYLRYAGLKGTWRERFLQRAIWRVLQKITGGEIFSDTKRMPAWLSQAAKARLVKEDRKEAGKYPRLESLFGLWTSQGNSRELVNSSRFNIELRSPYRDRRLAEFVLALPAYELVRRGIFKYILRQAMRGLLPEAIRTRQVPTSLGPLFFRGLEQEKSILKNYIKKNQAAWQTFVDPRWLSFRWDRIPKEDSVEGLIPVFCTYFEAWHEHTFPS